MPDHNDRRSHTRVVSSGTARVYRAQNVFDEFAIRDLSPAGARLIGTARLTDSERVHVVLDLPSASVAVTADVVRTDPQKAEVALRFQSVAPAALVIIEHEVASMIRSVRATRPQSVLVVHPEETIRAALERDISRLGRAATICATPLEAMWALDDSAAEHVSAIVGMSLGTRASELVTYLVGAHPHIRLALLFGDQLEPVDRDLSQHVVSVLRAPWRIRALARAIGVELNDTSLVLLPTDPDE